MAHFDESDDFNYEAQSSESYDAKEIGRRIKLARKARRISQKELAEMLNRSLRTIQKYESGDIEVSVAALVSVCQALRVPLSYLVGLGTRKALITSLADVMDFLFMLEKVKELHFAIEVEKHQRTGTGDAPSPSAARVRRPGIMPRCAFCLNSGKTNAKNSRRAKSQIRTTPTGKTRPYPTARLSALSLSGAKILIPWGVRPMKHPKKQMLSPGMKCSVA